MSGTDRIHAERQRFINGFTASISLVAFPIPLGDGTSGIILVDRANKSARIIAEQGYTHWSPRFSRDGERIVFARGRSKDEGQELLSCIVATWHCTTMLRTHNSLNSPVDVGNGDVMFASSPAVVTYNNAVRYVRNDLYIVKKGTPPKQLTELALYELGSISLSGDKILFQADGRKNIRTRNCANPDRCSVFEDESHIFALDFDPATQTIINPPEILTPLFIIAGLSVRPEVSADGTRVAFKHTNKAGGRWSYDILVATLDGVKKGSYRVKGTELSPGAFVGESLLFNELYGDHYRIACIDDFMTCSEITVMHSPEYLKTIERIALTIDPVSPSL